jgi:diacylglycerol kinase (ATP)
VKTCFVVNARSGRAAHALPLVRAFAARHGAQVVLTERREHGSELAREAVAAGSELVVAVGGDGTMNEVASALIDTPALFGLVPCGSGDGLGRHLGIHGRVERALRILETGAPRTIDSGVADGRPFFTAAGLGFEADIAHRFNQRQQRGFAGYLATAARAWRAHPVRTFQIDGKPVTAFTVAVANANQYGNGARIAPDARLDDGLLDLTVIPAVRSLTALPLLLRLFTGRLATARGVTMRRAARFVIETSAPGYLHTDGEVHEAGPRVEFTVRPASLRILAPA